MSTSKLDNLKSLVNVLTSLKREAESLIEGYQPLTEELNDEGVDSDMVQDLVYEEDSISEDEAVILLKNKIEEFVRDAQRVVDEIDDFSECVVKSEKKLDKCQSDLLKSVWYGDMYDVEGTDALKFLKEEIEKNFKYTDEDELVDFIADEVEKLKKIEILNSQSEST